MTIDAAEFTPYSAYHVGSSEKTSLDWQQEKSMNFTYGVPQGCVVRNTFLEWQEYEFENKDIIGGCDSDASDDECITTPLRLRPVRSMRRCSSCPDQFLSDTAEAFGASIAQPGLQRAYTGQSCPDAVKAKLLTADSLQAWSNGDNSRGDTAATTPGASGGTGSADDDSEDMPIEPWTRIRNGNRDYSEQGKWRSSPTSYSEGRSPESRVDSQRSLAPRSFDSKENVGKGGAKGGRQRDFESEKPKNVRECERSPSNGAVLTLRGLPFSTTEAEVLSFVEEQGCKPWLAQGKMPIHLIHNPMGRPSGYAEISIARVADFHEVRAKLHMQYFGQRYVEVLPQKTSAPGRYDEGRGGGKGGKGGGRDRDRDREDRDSDRTRGSWRRS